MNRELELDVAAFSLADNPHIATRYINWMFGVSALLFDGNPSALMTSLFNVIFLKAINMPTAIALAWTSISLIFLRMRFHFLLCTSTFL